MVKKKPTNTTKVGAEPIAKWNMITESDRKALEMKFLGRLADVSVSADMINSAENEFHSQEIERAEREHWDHYLRCDGLPRPYRPVEVRTFIAKMRHFDEIESNSSLDWTLMVDNRSVLNQNIFREDRTRSVMELKKDSPGSYYDANVKMCLDTLKQMDVMLDNEAELERMTQRQQFEIMNVYTEVQEEIGELINRLTYRVMKMQGAYMKSEDGKTANWSYQAAEWEMDLWGLLNVPIRFEQMELPVLLAEMKTTGIDVQIPTSVLQDCLTLRSVHTTFDMISQDAKSYEPAVTQSVNFPNAGIVGIRESVENEWAMQVELEVEKLALMESRRLEYENTMLLIAEKTEQAARMAKQNSGEKTNIVIPKVPKEPPVVLPGMFPDIYNDFLRLEDSQYAGYLDEVYHPRHLDMREFEINLRECIMLGGIYSVLVIRRPDQTEFEKFNIVLHEDGRVLYTMPDVRCDLDPTRPSTISQKTIDAYDNTNINLAEDSVQYFIVTVQLPADLCKWSQPEVCQFVSEQEPIEADTTNKVLYGSDIFSSDNSRRASFVGEKLSLNAGRSSNRNYSDILNIFRPSIRMMLRQSKIEPVELLNQITLENFKLKQALNYVEIRNLERHCLPRIISSFKLPRDMLDEIKEVDVPKTGLSRLVKRPDTEETQAQEVVSLDFTYEDQHAPERLFPNFATVDDIEYGDSDEFEEPGALYESTALGLLKKLDNIKDQYKRRPIQLLTQPDEVEKKLARSSKTPARVAETEPPPIEVAEKAPPSKPHKQRTERKLSVSKSIISIRYQDVTHWTKKYIFDTSLDQTTNRLTFKTDRLGTFGLAFKRYEHFPFRDWSMQPNEENPDEIILTVDTFHVRIFFYITTQGVRGYVTDLSTGYTAKPVKYLEIDEPISDFDQMRKVFISRNINIFAENDASYYIKNGYFSMKHVAAEHHTYDIMGLHCKLMKFYRSSWNRLAQRRDIIMNMKIAKDTSDYSEATLRITPEKTTFVQVSEDCSDHVDVIELSYTETWRNISHFTDVHQAICSVVFNAAELRNRDSILLYYVTRMLKELRPLSFS